MPSWSTHATSNPPPFSCPPDEPAESIAYVALAGDGGGRRDGIAVLDTDQTSATFGQIVSRVEFPHEKNGLRHIGWNACGPRARADASHDRVERRYLIVPGLESSHIHVVDTKPDPRVPRLVKVIDGAEVAHRTGYSAPHSVRCGPDGVYVSALGSADGEGPGGILTLHPETFDVEAAWERDRGPQRLASDLHWHDRHGVMITSEWGTPNMVRRGVSSELLVAGSYGRSLHVWDAHARSHAQTIDLGAEQQMVLRLRPAHNPARAYGFAGAALSLGDLSASVFLWYLGCDANGRRGEWQARKVITIRARPADPSRLPPMLRDVALVPPLITDVNLSPCDRWLFVSCWGTGELRRYDVADPFSPVLTGMVRLGGIVRRTPHQGSPATPRNGGPQMTTVSADGRRLYVTNALYAPWDDQFYPDGIAGWVAKVDADPVGGLRVDPRFLVGFEPGFRAHQVALRDGSGATS